MTLLLALFSLLAATCHGETASFLSNDGLYCAEGSSRPAEAAIALRKASPSGSLFNGSFVVVGTTCASQGYAVAGGADDCTLDVSTFFKTQADLHAFKASHQQAVSAFAATWSIELTQASLMSACSCQPGSTTWASVEGDCSTLASVESSWVHQNPANGDLMMCDQGPFVFNTRTLATIKASPQLAMHFHDQIAPVPCATLGFPYIYSPPDHCYTLNHMWVRTADIGTDPGIQESMATEHNLTSGSPNGFQLFAAQHNIGDMDVLNNELGCNCLPDSQTGQEVRQWCLTRKHSPVRDWWNGTYPTFEGVVI